MAAAMIPLTPDQVTELKNNASMAADTLKTLESNTTLANTCAEVNEVTGTCMRFNGLMRLEELANNDTALAAFKARRNLTDDQVTRLKDFVCLPLLDTGRRIITDEVYYRPRRNPTMLTP